MIIQHAPDRAVAHAARRAAAVARPLVGSAGARFVARTPLAGPLRRILSGADNAGPRLVTICGGALRGSRLCVDLSREKYYWLGTHEPLVQRTLTRAIRPGGVVFDVGAHIGFFSLLAAKRTGTTGRVIAFEPFEPNVARLRTAVTANAITNIESYCLAMSDHAGEESFALHDSSLEGLLLDGAALPSTHTSVVMVRTATIDTLVGGGIPAPDLIKIDVEGAEGRVIAGARETLAAHKPALLIEIHSDEAGAAVVDALPIAYLFEDIATHCSVTRALRPGHYLARAR